MRDKPIGEVNYDQFARRYAEGSRVKAHNALYERPATLSLLPDLEGRRVLDAGCGPGHYATELLARGAEVVAIDVTEEMVAITREEVGDRADVRRWDLHDPLTFAADASFDGVVCPLVLDYLEDWHALFAEFARVLRPGGWFVYSHGHPMTDYDFVRRESDPDANYMETEQHTVHWHGFGEPPPRMTFYRRPLQAMLDPLLDVGFAIEKVLEPLPTEECLRREPHEYEKLMREPCFLCVRARKSGES
ncbi:MAG: class I SAM-dependent methyltransferase [Planctomycetota bacterium]